MRARIFKLFFLAVIFITTNIGQVMAQCAMCRATVENNVSAGDTSLASGLNLGILYLFATPYVVFLVIAFLWYKQSKKNAKKVRILRYPKP